VLLIRKNINGQTTAFDWMKEIIEKKLSAGVEAIEHPGTVIRVPACYDQEYAPDLEWVASQNNISADELIQLHASRIYRVYMMGFLPGFSYMGVVNEKITAPRKLQPAPVKAGSIGIAGRQTGIYPLDSPGGWQIIGRTPLKLFDKERKDPVLLKSGDMIRFYSIPADEFVYLKNDRSNNV
jgi:inhibitor of KinA